MNSMTSSETEDPTIIPTNKSFIFYLFTTIIMTKEILLTGKNITIEDIIAIGRDRAKVVIPAETLTRVQENRDAMAEMLDRGDIMYGLNTGIG